MSRKDSSSNQTKSTFYQKVASLIALLSNLHISKQNSQQESCPHNEAILTSHGKTKKKDKNRDDTLASISSPEDDLLFLFPHGDELYELSAQDVIEVCENSDMSGAQDAAVPQPSASNPQRLPNNSIKKSSAKKGILVKRSEPRKIFPKKDQPTRKVLPLPYPATGQRTPTPPDIISASHPSPVGRPLTPFDPLCLSPDQGYGSSIASPSWSPSSQPLQGSLPSSRRSSLASPSPHQSLPSSRRSSLASPPHQGYQSPAQAPPSPYSICQASTSPPGYQSPARAPPSPYSICQASTSSSSSISPRGYQSPAQAPPSAFYFCQASPSSSSSPPHLVLPVQHHPNFNSLQTASPSQRLCASAPSAELASFTGNVVTSAARHLDGQSDVDNSIAQEWIKNIQNQGIVCLMRAIKELNEELLCVIIRGIRNKNLNYSTQDLDGNTVFHLAVLYDKVVALKSFCRPKGGKNKVFCFVTIDAIEVWFVC